MKDNLSKLPLTTIFIGLGIEQMNCQTKPTAIGGLYLYRKYQATVMNN